VDRITSGHTQSLYLSPLAVQIHCMRTPPPRVSSDELRPGFHRQQPCFSVGGRFVHGCVSRVGRPTARLLCTQSLTRWTVHSPWSSQVALFLDGPFTVVFPGGTVPPAAAIAGAPLKAADGPVVYPTFAHNPTVAKLAVGMYIRGYTGYGASTKAARSDVGMGSRAIAPGAIPHISLLLHHRHQRYKHKHRSWS
jgi:hypothetical protein